MGLKAEEIQMNDQPVLIDDFGCKYHGKAETDTGHLWWYTDSEGKRHWLKPQTPIAASDEPCSKS